MGISKQLFMEMFEHQLEEEDRYFYYSKKAEEMEWELELKKLNNKPKSKYIKILKNGKFTKKIQKRKWTSRGKRQEKSSSQKNNESVFY